MRRKKGGVTAMDWQNDGDVLAHAADRMVPA
jgi:hypothetical protein